MDRTPKVPLREIAVATRGPLTPQDIKVESRFREDTAGTRRRGRADRKLDDVAQPPSAVFRRRRKSDA